MSHAERKIVPSVMIVEPYGAHLDLMKDFIGGLGVNVISEPDQTAALANLRDVSPPDVLVLAHPLRGITSAFDFIRVLGGSVPIIVVSLESEAEASFSNQPGVVGFITKPYDPTDIQKRIIEILKPIA